MDPKVVVAMGIGVIGWGDLRRYLFYQDLAICALGLLSVAFE